MINWQTVAAFGLVAVSVIYLVVYALRKRRKPGCGGDCGCPSARIKAGLKH